jgi:hypothetical protein
MGATNAKSDSSSRRAPKKTDEEYRQGFEYICLEIEKGKALRRICNQFMSVDKFHSLCALHSSLNERYARACDIRAENIFEDIIVIADDNSNDTYIDDNGIERTDNDVIQRSRLRVDARKWVLSKMAPKKYGDKIDLTSDGEKLQSHVTIFQLPDNGRGG